MPRRINTKTFDLIRWVDARERVTAADLSQRAGQPVRLAIKRLLGEAKAGRLVMEGGSPGEALYFRVKESSYG